MTIRTIARNIFPLFMAVLVSATSCSKALKNFDNKLVMQPTGYETLYIYGGKNHTVFLGLLNGSKYDSDSIWDKYGEYGSKYNSNSIWNKYGEYGGKYGSYSPFNDFASYPPILLDDQNNFYGYFTSGYKTNKANFALVDIICKYHEQIAENPGNWYDKIFYGF